VTIAILDYGMGNLRSVARAIERVGGASEVVDDPGAVLDGDALVVPGVGHFGACMRNLMERRLDGAVRDELVALVARLERSLFRDHDADEDLYRRWHRVYAALDTQADAA